MSEIRTWTVVPMFLKPDALEGDHTKVKGPIAADFAAALAERLGTKLEHSLSTSDSGAGVARATERTASEIKKYAWLSDRVADGPRCGVRLGALRAIWMGVAEVAVADVVCAATQALGFEIAQSADRILTLDDYMAFYRYTDEPDMHERMKQYMLGKRVRLLLACGHQELSVLHIMKIYMRMVIRYPVEKPRMQNWLHVTDGDAPNYPELLRMFVDGACIVPAPRGSTRAE